MAAATQRTLEVAWQSPRPRSAYRFRLLLGDRPVRTTRRTSTTLHGLECGRSYVVRVEARRRKGRRSRATRLSASTTPCQTIDLAKRCTAQNCDSAFASLEPGNHYHLRAGTWKFTRPLEIPSNVTLTGDGTGLTGTDLVYSGPPTDGAIVVAGQKGRDWVNGHLAGVEIETNQLHQLRLQNDTQFAAFPITQAAIGLQIVNPTASSTVTNVNAWKFKRNSVRIDNHATSGGQGFFQFSNFFVGTSPRPIEVRGGRVKLLVRFGGIDLGPLSELAMLFTGDRPGAGGAVAVVESVKIEGDYDVPGFVADGAAPVVFVGSTRYYNQSLYVDNPINGAPAFLNRDPRGRADAMQCLGCTALGVQTALAVPGGAQAIPTNKWGINLHRLSRNGARAVENALATPETPLPRPQDVVDLSTKCVARNCDDALASLKFGTRYYLPAGVWHFSRPFTVPETATFFGDGPQGASNGGTTLRYVGPSLPGGAAAVRWGVGGGDMSGRLFSLRIDTEEPLDAGLGIRARDATNAATIEDIAVAGFPDGQLLLDATPNDGGSGPNFVRVARFSLTGGTHPLHVDGGRQTVLLQQGQIRVDARSQEGLNMTGGEQLAATRVVESVSVTGNRDVPGFRVRSPAVTAFVHSSRTAEGGGRTSPGFLYTALVPRRVTECLNCSVTGHDTAFAMPQLGVDVDAGAGRGFDHLNPNAPLETAREPFNVELPAVAGVALAGQTVRAVNGRWANDPSGYTYRWIRCKRPDVPSNPATRCVAIDGSTGPTHTVTDADVGFFLRVSVTAANASGSRTATSLGALAAR